MPKDTSIKKVLVIGSGPIVIGQAAEFDYAGAQACRVLREEKINTVLVNSNPATIMTDKHLADEIYLEPLTVESVKRIILREKPDGLLAGLGGQTGLTLAMQLEKEGFLKAAGVRLLGTDVAAIDRAEDRELFKETMEKIGQPCVPSDIATTVEECLAVAEKIGYPVIVRPAFTLGGTGGGIAANPEELVDIAGPGLDLSPITQVLIEKSIAGWKEIEFETMRDNTGEAVSVCSMENVDPVGVHTGDSIVAAPALTLTDREYAMLRQAALDIVTAIGVVGGCNCQFALKPDGSEYAVIEVNPRVSRSSALASKATGYPIAKVTTRLALGYTLKEIRNPKTGDSLSGFEPAVDYIVVKYPKFPFDKFAGMSRRLGTQMKATGEVMSIAPTFEAALMKAIRGAEIGADTLNLPPLDGRSVIERLGDQDDRRLFTVFEAIKAGVSIEKIYRITTIDPYFLNKIKRLADYEEKIKGGLTDAYLKEGKELGYTDKALERLSGTKPATETPFGYRIVKTCASVFGTDKPYFYSVPTVDGCEARSFKKSGKPVILVLGSGPIRIGQGIEFDYSSVHCVWTLKELGYDVAIINNNPETVSTDYDTADRLYFEPLTPEDVMNVIRAEDPIGVVVAFGGQTAIKLTAFLDRAGVKILGTSAEGIDIAEDRERFDRLLEKFSIKRPRGMGVLTTEEALAAAESLGYPVLLRPSYVIGGQNMTIVHTAAEVKKYMARILSTGIENPVLVDKYMMGPELEVDVISDGENVLIPGIMQHIERAGVHSGDSIAVYPPYSVDDRMIAKIVECSEKLALALGTKGLVNIQYLIYENELYVIEVNPRASRTVPYISKVTGVPMVDLAASVMTGGKLASLGYGTGLYQAPPYVTVKVPVFSFGKLSDANSYMGPEMKSTGEVLGIGKNIREALFKGMTSAGFRLQNPRDGKETGIFISVDDHDYGEIIGLSRKVRDLGMTVYATPGTAETIRQLGIPVHVVPGIREQDGMWKLLEEGKIHYIVYTGALYDETLSEYIALHRKALTLGVLCLTSLDTANAMADVIASGYSEKNTEPVDLNAMRREKRTIAFSKMEGSGDDYILIDATKTPLDGAESLAVELCDRRFGIGADGMVVLLPSDKADVKMRICNRDGSDGVMAGNSIRCVGKYLYDNGFVKRDSVTVETEAGIRELTLHTSFGHVTMVGVNMGKPKLKPSDIPCTLDGDAVIDRAAKIGDGEYRVTCLSVGNPHCVVFTDHPEKIDLSVVGPQFEYAPLFPERVNTEFVRVVSPTVLSMRVYERGNGETAACGTGAVAAAVAAVLNGYCKKDSEITVELPGGDLSVCVKENGDVILTGDAHLIYTGNIIR